MASGKNLRPRTPRPFQWLRRAARAAEDVPLASSALRRYQDAEGWALAELKQRLDAMGDSGPARRARAEADGDVLATPAAMLAELVHESRQLDPEAARARLYRQTLSRLVPDQVAMLALLADREIAPLVHVAAGRLPAGPVSVVVLTNASPLGRDAGVLLRDHVPQYMTELMALGVVEAGPERDSLAGEYELVMADTQIRRTMERIRGEMKLYPRLQRFSVHLSDYGKALWRDCRPPQPFVEHDKPAR